MRFFFIMKSQMGFQIFLLRKGFFANAALKPRMNLHVVLQHWKLRKPFPTYKHRTRRPHVAGTFMFFNVSQLNLLIASLVLTFLKHLPPHIFRGQSSDWQDQIYSTNRATFKFWETGIADDMAIEALEYWEGNRYIHAHWTFQVFFDHLVKYLRLFSSSLRLHFMATRFHDWFACYHW